MVEGYERCGVGKTHGLPALPWANESRRFVAQHGASTRQ